MYLPSLRKQYTETLRTLQAYQSAVNEAAIVSITDLKGIILFVNDKFVEVSKYSSAELIGKTHHIVNSDFHSKSFFKQMWQTIGNGKPWRGEIKNKTKDGNYYWVDTVITPVLDQKGNAFQYLSIRNLITAQKENEEQLRSAQQEIIRKEQLLKDAQEIAKMGSWHMTLPDERLDWSNETYHIFEISLTQDISYDFFLSKVYAEDRKMVNKKWMSALKTGKYDIEHRIITPSGLKWVQERARFIFSDSGNLIDALGTIQDITEKKKITDNLKESQDLYKSLFNNSPFSIGILDKPSLQFLEVNKTAVELYGYSKEEFLALTAFDIRIMDTPEEREALQIQKGYVEDKSVRRHRKKNGDIIYVEPSITEMNYKGKLVYLISIADVTEKLRMVDEIELIKINRQREIMEAQEESRSQIGRELHDNVNQLLAASRLYLKNVHTATDRDNHLIETAVKIITIATEEIRKLSANLVVPNFTHKTLKTSIENLVAGFVLDNITVCLNIDIDEILISDGLKINIYRIIQEQFNNILKYAQASKVNINLKQSANLIKLEIIDDGIGFDQKKKSIGIGLNNISYRAETYHGKVTIISSPGNGCSIIVLFELIFK